MLKKTRRTNPKSPNRSKDIGAAAERAGKSGFGLTDAHNEWEDIFQAIGHPALILDSDYNIISANRIVSKVTGIPLKEIFGKKCHEVFHGRGSQPEGCPLERMLKDGITSPVEMEIQALGGTYLVSCTPVSNQQGGIDKIIHIATDITEIKILQASLKHSEARLIRAQEIANFGTWEYDIVTQTLWGSGQAAAIYGIEHAGSESVFRPLKTVEDMIHPDDRPRIVAAFRALLNENRKYDEVFQIIRANDGEMRVIHAQADLVISDTGAPKVIGILEDITERKRMEDALNLSQTRLMQAHSVARLGCWELDLESQVVWGSREAALIYGIEYPGERDAFRPNEELRKQIHPEDLPGVTAGLQALVTENRDYDQEYRLYRADDGALRVIRSRADLVVSDSGKPLKVIGMIEDITERKRTEEALRKAEEKYRHLFENAMEGIFQTTPDGRFITANRAMALLFGYASPEELIESVTDIERQLYVNPDNRLKLFQAVREKGIVFGYECEFFRKDRSKIWISISIRAVKNQRGQVLYYEGFHLDITEKKTAERLVADALRYNQTILNASPVGIITYKASGQCASANKEIARIAGCTVEQILAQNFRRLKSWEESGMLAAAEQTIETGQARTSEFHLFTTFGREAWLSCSFTPLNYSGELHLLLIASDITERKMAEESLRKSEEKYRLLTDNSSDVIWTIGLDGCFTYVSPSWITLCGFEISDIIGSHFGKFIVEPDVPWVMDTIATELLKDPETRLKGKIVEARLRRKDSSILDVEIAASWLYDFRGEIIGLQGSTRDITERKRMEDNRARLEAQLAQAQKMEAIGTLAGGIAHDFNNILMSILGYTDIAMASRKIDDLQRHYLRQVYVAGERARDLVKQILTFSRHEEQERKPVHLEPLVRESLNLLRSSLPSTISISARIQEDMSIILGNATQIQQIIMNLCTNSSHAMKEGGGVLDISLAQEYIEFSEMPHPLGLAPGKYAKLKISDTGKGIDPAIMDRIFDPFFTTKPPEEGTGLGLSVVYGIVRNHGGIIDIASEPGKGTRVTVYLPVFKEGTPAVEELPEPIPRGSERILFIDDEPGLADLGKLMLENLGYTVTSRTASMDALEEFHADPAGYDLVITDMTMPKMTGAELARRMLEIRADIPIILCTGYSDIISEEKAKKIGIRHFVLKPISMKILAEMIRDVLKK